MSPLITLPHGLVDGVDTAYGADVLGNDQAIVQVVHSLDYQNLAANPNFPGTCISNTPGNRIPTDRLEDACITAAKLKSDSNPGSPLAAVSSPDHIVDGVVTKSKLANFTLTAAQLAYTEQSIPFSISAWTTYYPASGTLGNVIRTVSVDRYVDTGLYKFNVRGVITSGTNVYMGSAVVAPTTPISLSAGIVIAAYVADAVYSVSGPTLSGSLIVLSISAS